ncbi:hypothetical protein U1Q18_027850, partial [Sarracenia purpurea var. burkii]
SLEMEGKEEEKEAQELVNSIMDERGEKLMRSKNEAKLTIDELVEEYVGSLGFSQLLHVFLVSIAWIFDSQNTLVTIFTDAQPSAWRRCIGVGRGSSTISSSTPCAVFTTWTTGGGDGASLCKMEAGSWEWVGGHSTTTIAEWNLICDRQILAALPTSLFFLGSLLGTCFFSLPQSLFSRFFWIKNLFIYLFIFYFY